MYKQISVREFAAIKRIAQNSNANVTKKNRLEEKVQALLKEIKDIESSIAYDEAGLIHKLGMTSEALVKKETITTDKLDKDGNPIKVTKWVAREDVVTYNEEKKCYEVFIEENEVETTPSEEDLNALDKILDAVTAEEADSLL